MQVKIPMKSVANQKPERVKDDLVLKRKGGGSIIDHRPLFSHDGEILYVIWKQVIRTYSTQTGDFVREFEPIDSKIVGITFYSDNFKTIVGCTDAGELVEWNSQNGLVTRKQKLSIHDNVKVRTFHIVNYTNGNGRRSCQALVTYNVKVHNAIQLVLYDVDSGEAVKTTCIDAVGDYIVDIIGNHGENLVAIAQDVDLHILQPSKNLTGRWHKIGLGGRKLTCVAGHPEEECVASGDSSGRVVVWKNLFNSRPLQGTYHWHTLPVTEIVFSKSGGHMYTGGSECVLVKWTLANPNHKSFLPRLPAPIKHLTLAPENLYVAVSTLDNGIVVVNPQKKLTSVIQNFTWGVAVSRNDLFPAGLTLDPRTGSLVLNSRTGYVQFFDTLTKSLLYNINITAQNLLTQERTVSIINTDVTKIGLSNDGLWMGTVEERNDGITNPEVRLKFWEFNSEKQMYILNTSIELPHNSGVNALKFRPNTSLNGENLMAVTTGKDEQFKLWNIVRTPSVHNSPKHWQCYGIGEYRGLPSTDTDFSSDGSLLGVGFGPSLTIWAPESNNLKCSLTNSRYSQTITHVKFGNHETCHLIVVASSDHIAVWNLLSLSITWSVPLKMMILTADPNSSYMAAFTTNNTLFIFTPQSSTPVYTRKDLIQDTSRVLGACFVPQPCQKRVSRSRNWQEQSQLFFLDSNQELLTLETESEAAMSLESLTVRGNLPATAFESIVAGESSTNVGKRTPFHHEQVERSGQNLVDELLTVSAHTLPPMRMLCAHFITSLRAHNDQELKTQKSKSSIDMKTLDHDSKDESVDEKNFEPFKDKSVQQITSSLAANNSNKNSVLVSYDWNSLTEIFSE